MFTDDIGSEVEVVWKKFGFFKRRFRLFDVDPVCYMMALVPIGSPNAMPFWCHVSDIKKITIKNPKKRTTQNYLDSMMMGCDMEENEDFDDKESEFQSVPEEMGKDQELLNLVRAIEASLLKFLHEGHGFKSADHAIGKMLFALQDEMKKIGLPIDRK
jgi:hypothetical protein